MHGSLGSPDASGRSLPPSLVALLAVACGISVANVYYAHPLLDAIAGSFGISQSSMGIVVTVTQIGYGLGLFAVVPLGDILHRRRLIATQMLLSIGVLVVIGSASSRLVLLPAMAAAGALSAVRAGRLADRGRGRVTTGVALALLVLSWLPIAFVRQSLLSLVVGLLLLDFAVQAIHVTSQSLIYRIDPAARSRLAGGLHDLLLDRKRRRLDRVDRDLRPSRLDRRLPAGRRDQRLRSRLLGRDRPPPNTHPVRSDGSRQLGEVARPTRRHRSLTSSATRESLKPSMI